MAKSPRRSPSMDVPTFRLYEHANTGGRDKTAWAAIGNLDGVEPEEPYEGSIITHVYFLLDAEAAQIKIGFTTNLSRRIAQISHGRGRPLDLLGSLRGGRALERAMHWRFRPYRRWGNEWYSTEIIADVKKILSYDPQ